MWTVGLHFPSIGNTIIGHLSTSGTNSASLNTTMTIITYVVGSERKSTATSTDTSPEAVREVTDPESHPHIAHEKNASLLDHIMAPHVVI